MKNIDTIVQHITKPSDNIFLDLGFSSEDAERYLAESRRKIEEELNLKKRSVGDEIISHHGK